MANSNKIINAGVGYTVGNILIKGISFFTIPLYTRLMEPADYGIYNTYISYASFATFLVCLGLDPTLKNAEYDYRNKKTTYLSTIYILTLISTTGFLLTTILFRKNISKVFLLDEKLLLLLIFNAEASAIINIYNIKLSLEYASKTYLKIAFFNTVCGISLSLLLMLVVFPNARYMGRIVGMFIPLMIVAVIILVEHVIKIGQPRFSREMAVYALALGVPLVPHLIAQIINSQFDRVMISNMVGFSESGIYSFTYNIAIVLQIIYQSFDSVWSPWFFQCMNKKDYEKVKEASEKYVTLMAFLTIGLITISREFIMIFSTKEYWAGIDLCPVLIVGIFFLYLYTLPVGVEYFRKKTRFVAIGSLLAASCNITFNYIGIKMFGYTAAAYATLISYIILFVLHWRIYRKLCAEKIYNLKRVIICITVICIWTLLCAICKERWIIKYGMWFLMVIYTGYAFRNDIKKYISNLKNEG